MAVEGPGCPAMDSSLPRSAAGRPGQAPPHPEGRDQGKAWTVLELGWLPSAPRTGTALRALSLSFFSLWFFFTHLLIKVSALRRGWWQWLYLSAGTLTRSGAPGAVFLQPGSAPGLKALQRAPLLAPFSFPPLRRGS